MRAFSQSRRCRAALAVAVAAVFTTGAAVGAMEDGRPPTRPPKDMSPVAYAPISSKGLATAPTGSPRAILRKLVERARAAGLTVDATLARPRGVELAFAPAKVRGALWLREHITAPAPGPAGMGAMWRATMLAGALRDALHWSGGPPLAGARIYVTDLNDGHTERIAEGELSGATGQLFGAQSEAQARTVVLSNAAWAGLNVSALRVTTLLQPAVEVVVRVHDAARWIKNHSPEQLLFGSDTSRFEGVHVEVDDATTGRPVYAGAFAYRIADSYGWTPGLPPGFTRLAPGTSRRPPD